MSVANSSRERWIYGSGAPEAFLSFLAMMLWFSLGSLPPFLAVGWVAFVGYWSWTGVAWQRRFLVAWYASAALTLAPFWPPSGVDAVTLLLSMGVSCWPRSRFRWVTGDNRRRTRHPL